jgi:hypothetical protein
MALQRRPTVAAEIGSLLVGNAAASPWPARPPVATLSVQKPFEQEVCRGNGHRGAA